MCADTACKRGVDTNSRILTFRDISVSVLCPVKFM